MPNSTMKLTSNMNMFPINKTAISALQKAPNSNLQIGMMVYVIVAVNFSSTRFIKKFIKRIHSAYMYCPPVNKIIKPPQSFLSNCCINLEESYDILLRHSNPIDKKLGAGKLKNHRGIGGGINVMVGICESTFSCLYMHSHATFHNIS